MTGLSRTIGQSGGQWVDPAAASDAVQGGWEEISDYDCINLDKLFTTKVYE